MFFPERIKGIAETDKVLEIGPGASPFPRSDALLEKIFDENEAFKQRGLQPKTEYSKPVYYHDGRQFPFQDKEFDYVICAQVLEHVPADELANFIKEMERVAKRGYIEVPSLFYEYLFNFHVHKWLINFKDGKLLLLDKGKIKFSYIQDVFYLMLQYGFQKKNTKIIDDFVDLFGIGYEWENKINYEIVGSLDELISSKDVAFYKEYFMRLEKKNTDVYCRKSFLKKISGEMLRSIRNHFK